MADHKDDKNQKREYPKADAKSDPLNDPKNTAKDNVGKVETKPEDPAPEDTGDEHLSAGTKAEDPAPEDTGDEHLSAGTKAEMAAGKAALEKIAASQQAAAPKSEEKPEEPEAKKE